MKPRIAIWAAVSSKEQATDEKTSLETQEQAGREYAAQVGGEVVRVYRVPGHSRSYIKFDDAAEDMEAYRQLEADCEAGTFDVLWCRNRGRLGRTEALGATTEAIIKASGAEVYSASMGVASDDPLVGSIERGLAEKDQLNRKGYHRTGMIARTQRGLPSKVAVGVHRHQGQKRPH